jgi:hypothetical protein
MLKECAFGVAPNCSEMQRSETIRYSNSYSVARLTGSGVRTLAHARRSSLRKRPASFVSGHVDDDFAAGVAFPEVSECVRDFA